MTIIYGIRNCGTMKKALAWLDGQGVEYTFHDYKKLGVPAGRLRAWVERLGWQALLNTRGTTFRKLPPARQAALENERALALMIELPSLIRRPVLEHGEHLLVGFDAEEYRRALPGARPA